jgi:queuine tRNA-ribosyltransferase
VAFKSSQFQFQVHSFAEGSQARLGELRTPNAHTETPLFMPVATRGTLRHIVGQDAFIDIAPSILLANTYHLMLQPGVEVLNRFGGLRPFMKWDKAFLTDSGGFQIFSLDDSRVVTESGATFRSFWDGSKHHLTPEKSLEVQSAIGSDIAMVLDVCVPSTVDHSTANHAMERTHRWAERSLRAHLPQNDQALFGIIQGACFEDLRKQSAAAISEMEFEGKSFDGIAIGGLAVGESRSERQDFTEIATRALPLHRPRYLMGVGTPLDLVEAVHRGVDMFDCILPHALSEQGVVYTHKGRLRIMRGVYKGLNEPLDEKCYCLVCKNYSKAYIHHLKKTREPVGTSLIAHHNLFFYRTLMETLRAALRNGSFLQTYKYLREEMRDYDPDYPPEKPKKTLFSIQI